MKREQCVAIIAAILLLRDEMQHVYDQVAVVDEADDLLLAAEAGEGRRELERLNAENRQMKDQQVEEYLRQRATEKKS